MDETIRVPVEELEVDTDPGAVRGEVYIRGAETACPTCGQPVPGAELTETILGEISIG